MACLLAGGVASALRAADELDDRIVLMPSFKVEDATIPVRWRYATCEGFELLSDQNDSRTRLFATEFATFLRFVRQVCPELLLPEGTRLSIVLANPEHYADLVPLFPSPLGYAERPKGVLARTQDTAILAMCYDGVPGPTEYVGLDGIPREIRDVRDGAARDTLIRAQATYFSDPALVRHRQVLRSGNPPERPFIAAVGESRPFLASRQTFLKTAVVAVLAEMGNAVKQQYSFHDQRERWDAFFPGSPARTQELWLLKLPIKTLPPLENLFAIDVDSPAWSSPLHRLERDALVHWALLANGPERARVFLDFLARWGGDPVTPAQFAAAFGESEAEVMKKLITYLDPKNSRTDTTLPARDFWNRLPHNFPDAGRTYVSHEATPEESARIRADCLRLVGNNVAAERVLSTRFKKQQLNDHIWITTGLMMLERRNAVEAARSFRAAIALGTQRPLPFVELARMQLALARVKRGGARELSGDEAREIAALLREADARPPALRSTAALLCDLVEWDREAPPAAWLDLLEQAALRWPYETALLARAASVVEQRREHVRAQRLLAAARASTLDTETRARLDRKAGSDGAVTASPPSSRRVAPIATEVSVSPIGNASEPERRDFAIPALNLAMARIAPGRFRMGSTADDPFHEPDQGPVTTVTITRGFWIGKCEVTQRQWTDVMGTTLRQQLDRECRDLPANGIGDTLPMYAVSWDEAMEFCRRLTARERAAGRIAANLAYTLPTEAQWEYACRAGAAESFTGVPSEVAWLPTALPPRGVIPFNTVLRVATVKPVGGRKANAWGLHDMYGNVSEWCRDWYALALPGGEAVDPAGPASGSFRVVRGGSCWGVETGVPIVGSAVRSKDLSTARFGRGFRPVLVEQAGER
jgi:formylglycine-generating enzyme required for sulfatase activity